MPSIVRTYDPKTGPLIRVRIVPKGTLDWSKPEQTCEFLLDTGANSTLIAPHIAGELGLQPQGRSNLMTASGRASAPYYLADLGLIFDEGKVHWEHNHRILAFPGEALIYDGIIGRDIICRGNFSISREGFYGFYL
ncbi:MAG: retropepsin-like aspartic protease [Gammaproteobacteria bacterium]|nr:retropepsin-like aspartic protease [Gammaproteobacteria bacterium]